MKKDMKIFQQAYEIAANNLRQCYKDGKVLASLKNFSDYWARDTFWAFKGIILLSDFEISKNCLKYFLKFQRNDGKIPRKIALDFNGIKYISGKSFLRKKPRAIFSGNLAPFDSMDANALLIISSLEYVLKSGDKNFAKAKYPQLKRTIDWYEKKKQGGFVHEYGLGNWMDTIFKNGCVLYSNVMYSKALKSFSNIANIAGWENDCIEYSEKYNLLKREINKQFWNGKFFDDQLGKHEHFDLAGNVLAAYFKIADEEKRKIVSKKLISLRRKHKLLPTVFPKYPWWKVNPVTYLFGMEDYHNGISWMWIDCLASVVLFETGYKKEAQKYFEDICEIIVKNGAVYETYFSDGRPYKAKHWESAVPFAWGSGVFLKISDELKRGRPDES